MAPPNTPEPPTAPPESILIERLRDGDSRAFDLLIERYWKPLVHYLTTRAGDQDMASDLAQETLIRLWERRRDIRVDGSFRAYLYRIARNLSVDEGRRERRRERLLTSMEHEAPAPRVETPLELVLKRRDRRRLEAAITALPERRREAFTLVHVHEMSYQEAAEIMEISRQTVANHVATALSELRARLRPGR